ncbi:MAG: Spx/MgsR family RNA polymerase-binding regulatory protein [Clostridiaceae bacterium]|nr:Spx/MgsR family RNA polymerase-binding regulatory protein [Clostridiaceae bacterium]
MFTLICYKKCSTCTNVEKILQAKNLDYQYREIDKNPPTAKELKEWIKINEQPITKWLNTSGQKYRALNISQKRKTMSESELLELMATDGMLIKRPILFIPDDCTLKSSEDSLNQSVLVGPQVQKWLNSIE